MPETTDLARPAAWIAPEILRARASARPGVSRPDTMAYEKVMLRMSRPSGPEQYHIIRCCLLRIAREMKESAPMTPQERELLTGLFDRLKQCDRNPKEPDADRFIAQAVAAQPWAPYFMAQLLLVQDRALTAAQTRIRQLEQEAEAARAQPATPARSLLGETPAMGPWDLHRGTAAQQVAPATAAAASPVQAPAQSGGGFLRGALRTAAGVAGGALLFEGISSLLRHGGGAWGGGFLPTGGAPTLVEETVINEYGGAPRQPLESGSETDPGSSTQASDADAGFLTPAADDVPGDDTDWTDDQDRDLV